MNKDVIEILKEFDDLVLEINEIALKIKVGDSPFRDATCIDRLEFLREEWFKVAEKLNDLGIDITSN